MVKLYRCGNLTGTVADGTPAPPVAVKFDSVAARLGFPQIRANSVYFSTSIREANVWEGPRYWNGLDTKVYEVVVNQLFNAYSIEAYDKFKKLYDEENLAVPGTVEHKIWEELLEEAVTAYFHSGVIAAGEEIERYEILIPISSLQSVNSWNVVYEPVYA